ncbi:MAG: PP2C family protein-serine/threonine phosphatase, partial [Candidatus Binatia bacterium]
MKVQSSALSDVGLVRRENQDTSGHFPESNLFVVADGMGGHAGGKQASQMAVETIEECVAAATLPVQGFDLDQVIARFLDAIKIANRRIVDRAATDTGLHKMGTTLVALLLDGKGSGAIIHIGDSRAYRLRGGELELLTTDHTLVSDLLKSNEISESEASEHPYRHVLTRALGAAEDATADVRKIDIAPDDLFVLCTDGISGMVA